jgi:hypothetical protein
VSWGETLRGRLRFHPAAVQLRAVRRSGWRGWISGSLARGILRTAPVRTDPAGGEVPVEVHLLCHRHDHLIALWALKSFYRFAGVRLPLVVHLQGRVPERARARLRTHFPDARIVDQAEADAVVVEWLRRRGRRLLEVRGRYPILMKLTDFALLSRAGRLLAVDSDVLFFAPPAALLAAVRRGGPGSLFQRDVGSGYTVPPAWARERLGIDLVPRINTGIMSYPRDPADLERCEQYLEQPELMRPSGVLEQTLHALRACERGPVEFLPPEYLIRLEPGGGYDGLTARHYAGPSRRLLPEGMRVLRGRGFLGEGVKG